MKILKINWCENLIKIEIQILMNENEINRQNRDLPKYGIDERGPSLKELENPFGRLFQNEIIIF
ncbi:hypothetical protein [Spiroplasma poulsonii]|uniref:hypothetical protein n=1 Tax=Spiroplasma poulsonii TaxID=2138 RepID=UPI001F4D0EAF|nr:hypothetical protein [Spiroplasma poulsonii]UNF62427.1 hypothetical protein MNU24_02880 [Spiroplasma poulsonii]